LKVISHIEANSFNFIFLFGQKKKQKKATTRTKSFEIFDYWLHPWFNFSNDFAQRVDSLAQELLFLWFKKMYVKKMWGLA